MMSAVTIVEFLRARLDEDEAAAKAASPGPWHVGEDGDEVMAVDEVKVTAGFALSNRQLLATTVHIARHDPARVLREVESKRAIVDAAVIAWNESCNPTDEFWSGVEPMMRGVLRRLASVYADHPDYDPAWRPA